MSSPVEEHFICNKCKHLRPLSGGCAAFPEDKDEVYQEIFTQAENYKKYS